MEGRHAHGELEAHGGWGEKYGCCVLPDGRRDGRAMVGERRGAERPARGLSKKRPGLFLNRHFGECESLFLP